MHSDFRFEIVPERLFIVPVSEKLSIAFIDEITGYQEERDRDELVNPAIAVFNGGKAGLGKDVP